MHPADATEKVFIYSRNIDSFTLYDVMKYLDVNHSIASGAIGVLLVLKYLTVKKVNGVRTYQKRIRLVSRKDLKISNL